MSNQSEYEILDLQIKELEKEQDIIGSKIWKLKENRINLIIEQIKFDKILQNTKWKIDRSRLSRTKLKYFFSLSLVSKEPPKLRELCEVSYHGTIQLTKNIYMVFCDNDVEINIDDDENAIQNFIKDYGVIININAYEMNSLISELKSIKFLAELINDLSKMEIITNEIQTYEKYVKTTDIPQLIEGMHL